MRFLARAIVLDAHTDAINLLNDFFCEHSAGHAVAVNPPIAEDHQTRKKQRREIEVVQRRNDGEAALAIEPE